MVKPMMSAPIEPCVEDQQLKKTDSSSEDDVEFQE